MNKQTRNRDRLINTENKLMVARGEGGGKLSKMGEREREIQTSSYVRINHKNKSHSIRNTLNGILIVI